MALWIRVTEGSVISTRVTPLNGKAFTLPELQRMVGGYIEALPLRSDAIMWLNEEGKLNGLPYNPVADQMAHEQASIAPWDKVVGNVVIATREESNEGNEEDEEQ